MVIAFLLALLFGPADAEVRLDASADRARVAPGDAFSFTVVVEATDLGGNPAPDLGLPSGVDVLGKQSSSSTSISIVNGAMAQTRSVTFLYTLRIHKPGAYTLGPARISLAGKSHASNAVHVEVVKGQARPRSSARGGGQADQLLEIEENLFVKVTADRHTVYVGEQVLISYDLYTRYRLQNVRYARMPSFTGFWAETVFDANRLEKRRQIVGGRPFDASPLKRVALFPTASGEQALEQLEVQCDIPVKTRRRSQFDVDDFLSFDPFRTQQVTIRAEDLTIEVKSLPPNAPRAFTGGVGTFTLDAAASPSEVGRGDPVSLVVTVHGAGNLHALGAPVLELKDRFRVYDPRTRLDTRYEAKKVVGEKVFEFVLIPNKEGQIEIPVVSLAYFDPRAGAYRTVESGPIALNVLPGEPEAPARVALPAAESVKLLGEDIRHIKGDVMALTDQGVPVHADWRFLSVQLIPVVCFLAGLSWHRHWRRLASDVAYARRRRSRGEVNRRLAEAGRLLEGDDGIAYHAEVHRALSAFLADRLNLVERSLTSEDAERVLEGSCVEAGVRGEVAEILRACDLARFSPVQPGIEDRRTLYDRTASAIGSLERSI